MKKTTAKIVLFASLVLSAFSIVSASTSDAMDAGNPMPCFPYSCAAR
jgi:hypothetical protein